MVLEKPLNPVSPILSSSSISEKEVTNSDLNISSSSKKINEVKSINESSIKYCVKGSGDITIVFVHCWTCNRTFWDSQIDHFSEDYQVIALDLAGHGESTSKRKNYTMAAFGQDVVSVVNAVEAKQIILVGHSMGGAVSIEAAKILGDRVIGIIGVDIFYNTFNYPKNDAEIKSFVKPFEKDFKKSSEELVRSIFIESDPDNQKDFIVNTTAESCPKMAISALIELFSWKLNTEAKDLKQMSEKITNINAAPTGQEKPLDKSVILVENVGHYLPQINPQKFNTILTSIINDLLKILW